eukprot:Awhi_evm1s1980
MLAQFLVWFLGLLASVCALIGLLTPAWYIGPTAAYGIGISCNITSPPLNQTQQQILQEMTCDSFRYTNLTTDLEIAMFGALIF